MTAAFDAVPVAGKIEKDRARQGPLHVLFRVFLNRYWHILIQLFVKCPSRPQTRASDPVTNCGESLAPLLPIRENLPNGVLLLGGHMPRTGDKDRPGRHENHKP